MYQSFLKDLAVEKQQRETNSYLLQAIFNQPIKEYSNNKYYDIVMNNGIKVELKTDYKAITTGNIAIEAEDRIDLTGEQRPSGILVTQADYWLYSVLVEDNNVNSKYNLYLWDKNKLRDEIRNTTYKRRTGKEGSTVILLPINSIRNNYIGAINLKDDVVTSYLLIHDTINKILKEDHKVTLIY